MSRQTMLAATRVMLIAAALALPAVASEKWMAIAVIVIIWAVLGTGLNVVAGFAGLLDLGFVAFFAIGAYSGAIMSTEVLPPDTTTGAPNPFELPVSLVVGGLLAGVVAAVLGYPTLRLRGDYLAIMTLGFGELAHRAAINWEGITGGPNGLPGVPPPSVFGFDFVGIAEMYYLGLGLAAVTILVVIALVRSHVGRAWIAIREDEDVAESLGIPTSRYKLYAYVTGGVAAGVIGVFFARTQQFISPDSFTLIENIIVLVIIVVGGLGSVWAGLVGATLWFVSQELLAETSIVQDNPELRLTFLALILLLVMLIRPQGVLGPVRSLGSPAADSRFRVRADAIAKPAAAPMPIADGGGSPTLKVDGLSRSFGGVAAVEDVALSVSAGEVVGLVGPNGAGKTSVLNLITGFLVPDSGRILVDGVETSSFAPHEIQQLGVARTFQQIRLFPTSSVLENCLAGMHDYFRAGLWRIVVRSPSFRRERHATVTEAYGLLKRYGIESVAEQPAGTLPYGSQRMVELARAVLGGPRVLCLDEPTAGMNARESEDLGMLIRGLAGSGIGVLLVEHDMDVVRQVCDRIVVLQQGRVIREGEPWDVLADSAVVEAYLGPAYVDR